MYLYGPRATFFITDLQLQYHLLFISTLLVLGPPPYLPRICQIRQIIIYIALEQPLHHDPTYQFLTIRLNHHPGHYNKPLWRCFHYFFFPKSQKNSSLVRPSFERHHSQPSAEMNSMFGTTLSKILIITILKLGTHPFFKKSCNTRVMTERLPLTANFSPAFRSWNPMGHFSKTVFILRFVRLDTGVTMKADIDRTATAPVALAQRHHIGYAASSS